MAFTHLRKLVACWLAVVEFWPSCLLAAGEESDPAIRLPAILSDNAVFQADKPIPIWGWAQSETSIVIQIDDNPAVETTSNVDGSFYVDLPPMEASAEPVNLRLSDEAGHEISLENVLIGDVWVAGGQSNMEWELENASTGQVAALGADDPAFRFFEVERRQRLVSDGGDVTGRWVVAAPRSPRKFSAVGYFFGEALREKTGRPIGVIQIAYGGTRIEAWTPMEVMAKDPSYADEVSLFNSVLSRNLEARRHWISQISKWMSEIEKDGIESLEAINPPVWPAETFSKQTPAVLFNGMVRPILPNAMKGLIWYQGESNWKAAASYEHRLETFIHSWREHWGEDFPVGLVQIAPYERYTEFPEIWQAQLKASQNVEGVGLIVISDLGNPLDIHPRKKRGVGERLAQWAARDVYEISPDYYTGPLFFRAEPLDERVLLHFEFSGGLKDSEGKVLKGFEIAESDGEFAPIMAIVKETHVEIELPEKSTACRLRYAWRSSAVATLTNSSGIPASSFRTEWCNDGERPDYAVQ